MTHSANQKITNEEEKERKVADPFKDDLLAKSITTGVAVSTVNHTGRSIISSLIKHPLILFGVGLTTGYFVGKYRKEIISAVKETADQSKRLIPRKKDN